jgi:hypothetical protein
MHSSPRVKHAVPNPVCPDRAGHRRRCRFPACSKTTTSLTALTADKCQVASATARRRSRRLAAAGFVDHHHVARLHLVDQVGRGVGVDCVRPWRAGEASVPATVAQPGAVRAQRRHRRGQPERGGQPGGRGVCLHAEPFGRRDWRQAAAGSPSTSRRSAAAPERASGASWIVGVVGSERQRHRHGRAGGGAQPRSLAGWRGRDRQPELRRDTGGRVPPPTRPRLRPRLRPDSGTNSGTDSGTDSG